MPSRAISKMKFALLPDAWRDHIGNDAEYFISWLYLNIVDRRLKYISG